MKIHIYLGGRRLFYIGIYSNSIVVLCFCRMNQLIKVYNFKQDAIKGQSPRVYTFTSACVDLANTYAHTYKNNLLHV